MKRNGRVLSSVAATIFLAAVLLAAPGCPKPVEPTRNPFLVRAGEAVNVLVEYDASTKKAVMSPKTVYLREGKDWVLWVSCDGTVSNDLRWKDGAPWDNKPTHAGKFLKSDKPKAGTAWKHFDYDADLVLPDGTKIQIEPRIEIMP